MLFLAYAGFVVVVWLAVRQYPTFVSAHEMLVRVTASLAGTSLGAGASVSLLLQGDQDEPWASVSGAVIGGEAAGAIVFLIGTLLWRGQAAFVVRVCGFALMTAPLLVPSTLSLLLLPLSTLAVTLHKFSPPRTPLVAQRAGR